MIIIGLTGYAESGKSTAAEYLTKYYGFTEMSLAEPLKEAARYLGWNGVKDDKGRDFLQRLGTEAIRGTFGQDFWVNLLIDRIKEKAIVSSRFVISDIRFTNEADSLRLEFGDSITIVRIKHNIIGPCNSHPSELDQTRIDVDYMITNVEDELRRMYDELDWLMERS